MVFNKFICTISSGLVNVTERGIIVSQIFRCNMLPRQSLVGAVLVIEAILGLLLVLSFFETEILYQGLGGIALFSHSVYLT